MLRQPASLIVSNGTSSFFSGKLSPSYNRNRLTCNSMIRQSGKDGENQQSKLLATIQFRRGVSSFRD